MGVGRGGALGPPWILKLPAKKVVFSISRVKNQISPLLAPPGKNFGKIPYWPPLEKILPTPMAFTNIFLKKLPSLGRHWKIGVYEDSCWQYKNQKRVKKDVSFLILFYAGDFVQFRFLLFLTHINFSCVVATEPIITSSPDRFPRNGVFMICRENHGFLNRVTLYVAQKYPKQRA